MTNTGAHIVVEKKNQNQDGVISVTVVKINLVQIKIDGKSAVELTKGSPTQWLRSGEVSFNV